MLAALKRRLSGLVVAFAALVLALGAVTPHHRAGGGRAQRDEHRFDYGEEEQ